MPGDVPRAWEMGHKLPSQVTVAPLHNRSLSMQSKVQKGGSSLGVRIPCGLAEAVGFEPAPISASMRRMVSWY